MEYPSLLRPTATEVLTLNGQTTAVPKVRLELRPWLGAPLSDPFGGKPLVEVAGRPMFAELAIYELFRLSGWQARWVETYGAPAARPHLFMGWREGSRTEQPHQPLTAADAGVAGQLAAVAARRGSHSGCWDVLAWHGPHLLFAEAKRRGKDRIRPTQTAWLAAALGAGLRVENFLFVEWDFIAPLD